MTLKSALIRSRDFVIAVGLLAALATAAAAAQRQPAGGPAGGPAERPGRPVVAAPVATDMQDANETRDKLQDILQKYPPTVGTVLKLDPSLLNGSEYLSTYPALAAFVGGHPEIAHNPDFFFANVRGFRAELRDPQSRSFQMFDQILGGLAGLIIFGVVVATLVWLIRTIIEYRRWNRLSKVQTDVHTKLLDRFTANDDLLAYIQTPAGRKFLESAPIPLQEQARSVGAPFSRILWSVQAGVVLSLLGIGLLFVAGRTVEEVAQGMFVLGVLTLALGVGFVVSAVVAYGISRRLGLLDRPAAEEHA